MTIVQDGEYPELEKQREARADAAVIGAFLDWCSEQGYRIATYDDYDNLCTISGSIENLLQRYFEIDGDKLEEERTQLLDRLTQPSGPGEGTSD